MNKDYAITLHTSDPTVFDQLPGLLEEADWDAEMTCVPTGDSWRKSGTAPRSSQNEPSRLQVVDDGNERFKSCMLPDCGCNGDWHP